MHQKLAEGGYSTIYKCTDELGIRYVCKQLPKLKNKRTRIENEIHAMQSMSFSPKIVQFVDAMEDEENYYIVQEWCRGGDVKSYITTVQSQLTENTVASIIRGTLRGLVHLHEKRFIHRDIKPANIVLGDLSEDSDVKICDLGTCVYVEDVDKLTEVDELVGTAWYMGPENLSYDYCAKSDIWSVGVMAYQLLTGKMPFNDREDPFNPRMSAIWRSILTNDLKYPSNMNEDAKDFIMKCLQNEYKARPTAREALQHVWLTKTDCNDRFKGMPLQVSPFEFEMNAATYKMIKT